jgi:monoterpene epsilon-lactone hydrolase
LRTTLVNLVIRGLIKPRLAACRTPLDVRKAFAATPALAPRGVRFTQSALGGVAGEWAATKRGAVDFGAMLYLHGGGYVAMSARTHRAITGGFARRGFRVFAPDYRLAPEHQFPAALDDAAAAWRAMRAEVEGPIFVAGDSAGGGLAAALLLRLRDLGEAGPTAACFFSPWADLAVTGESLTINRDRDPMQVASAFRMLAAVYLGAADPRLPLASPIYGDFAGLPPLLAFVGDGEILRSRPSTVHVRKVTSATSWGCTQWTRDNSSGRPKRAVVGCGTSTVIFIAAPDRHRRRRRTRRLRQSGDGDGGGGIKRRGRKVDASDC